ncbi:hypothetical protein, partial [Clostridioides difficile]|uniref:hypothetical protein n=1 Tax=Clostridioides difficile TaxID=1496 RepID=UPI0018DC1C8D
SSENPILISHASGHMGVANTLGLKQLGVTNETRDPEGGHIGRVEGSEEPLSSTLLSGCLFSSKKLLSYENPIIQSPFF